MIRSAIRRLGAPLLVGFLAVVAVSLLGETLRLPRFFPWSDAAIAGGAAAALALGLAMLLPHRWLATPVERLQDVLMSYPGMSASLARATLSRAMKAHGQADLLRAADNGFHDALAGQVRDMAGRLDAIARLILTQPGRARDYGVIIVRADLAVEAVAKHARLRASSGADAARIETARGLVGETLANLAEVIDATEQTRVDAQLDSLGITTDVADDLFDQMKQTG